VSDDRDIDLIDLDSLDAEETGAFFMHLTKHAVAGQHDAVIGHIQEVNPTPANIMYLMMGLAQSMSALSKAILGKNPDEVRLKFGVFNSEEDLPDQKAVLDGDTDARALLDEHTVGIDMAPRALRIAGQLMSAGIAGDTETVGALALPLAREYDDLLNGDEDLDPAKIDALNVVIALAQGLVQYATAFDEDDLIAAVVDRMVEDIEAEAG
jgi:hypothetical protein